MAANDGLSRASESAVVPGRTCSSWSSTVSPLRSMTGTTERVEPAVLPRLGGPFLRHGRVLVDVPPAPAARSVAMRSAPIPCGTKPTAKLVIGSANQAPPSEAIGTRDIDSTPPASTRSSQPERILAAARLTASRPEAQKRFSCTPATVSGSPAAIAAMLGDVGALVADRADDAEHDVVHGGRVQVREAAPDLVDQADDQVDGFGGVQRAVGLAATARGADRVVDVRFGAHVRHSLLRAGRMVGGQDSSERPMISFMISVVPP